MTALPPSISAALQQKLENVSRAALRASAQAISERYRAGGSSDIIRSEFDALAYAVVRMPATYAAVRAALAWTDEIIPDFAPRTVLDVGAGPGTASWAACDAWPSLQRATLVDRNAHLLALARQLHERTASPLELTATEADVTALDGSLGADMILASYALTELAPTKWQSVLAQLWKLAGQLLVIVEPGTMAGFKRVLQYRDFLLGAGARIVAPCSHEGPCPLAESARWCHFSARLPRLRDHLLAKGADVPFEDEKFSYLIAGKNFGDLNRGRRILASPRVSKASVALTLCAPETPEDYVVDRRSKDAYRAAKRCGWGDAINCKTS